MKRLVIVGVAAGTGLLAFYFGVNWLAQGLPHAVGELGRLWFWTLPLAAGFGVQTALFYFIRRTLAARRRSATASMAVSGGVSAGSMVVCCVHHLADVLPFLGISAAAGVLASYQTFFLIMGITANLVGTVVMLETVQRHGLCPWVATWTWDMARVRRWSVSAGGALLTVMLVIRLTAGWPA